MKYDPFRMQNVKTDRNSFKEIFTQNSCAVSDHSIYFHTEIKAKQALGMRKTLCGM